MQLTVFSTDNEKTGFRLQYLEVYNWGTFHNQVWRIEPVGETALLTGANGSGKTTFVDALLTLMVPERRMRFYNQSSGSEKKGDRSEETYVLGAYGTVPAESGSGMKTIYLREEKDTAYSILLAHFANEAQQVVTLFQVRYFSGGDMKRFFGIAHKALRIETDFIPFDLNGGWKRRLDLQYNRGASRSIEWPDSASRYAQHITEVLGMQSQQALGLFNQTVGIKVMGDLNEFIRTHMLEPRNIEGEFQELKKQLATLLEVQRNLEKIALQIQLLLPVKQQHLRFGASEARLADADKESTTVKIWHRYTHYQLLQQAVAEGTARLSTMEKDLTDVRREIERLQESERNVINQIEGNQAGQRLQQLRKDLENYKQKHRSAENALRQFTDWCTELGLNEKDPVDDATYQRIMREAKTKGLQLATRIRLAEEDVWEGKGQQDQATKALEDIEPQLAVLLTHRNNIPAHLIHLREQLCTALKLPTAELPFAGELMQVKADEGAWQPALEKLLHSFSLRLLVPEKHYRKVAQYVNRENLRTRLVYYAVGEVVGFDYAEEGSVFQKLEFLQENKMWRWVAAQIVRLYPHQCLETETELERFEFALTVNGMTKSRDRHEKDDRPHRNDPGNYVMGWNNERKKESLQRRRDKLLDQKQQGAVLEEKGRRKQQRLQKEILFQKRIEEHEGFSVLDVGAVQRSIRKTEEDIRALQASSDQLKVFTEQLEAIKLDLKTAGHQRDGWVGDFAKLEGEMEKMQGDLNELKPLVDALQEKDKDDLLAFQQRQAQMLSGVHLADLYQRFETLKEHVENHLCEAQEERRQAETALFKAISKLKSPDADVLQRFPDWAADVHTLPSDVAYAGEYVEWLERLEAENLPHYRGKFEQLLHETAVHKIGLLNEELEQWERQIRKSIYTLNQSLSGIQFNRLPDTYIRLENRPVPDSTIKEFRAKLLAVLPDQRAWQQSSFEEKEIHFRQQVQPLVTLLDSSESYRAKVLDVRNWFEFWATELYRNTGELKKAYRQMGQLSGGEKAQLTYTILCSAIAYQFGITREGRNARSLRFIAVDESFSNQDEEKATYLMELCRQLHLQLLVVTPSDKIQVVESFIAHVHLVQRRTNGESILYNMTKKELQEHRDTLTAAPTI